MLYKEKPSSNKQYAKQNKKTVVTFFFFQTGKVLLIPVSLSMVGAING